jgi:hypothetical protein
MKKESKYNRNEPTIGVKGTTGNIMNSTYHSQTNLHKNPNMTNDGSPGKKRQSTPPQRNSANFNSITGDSGDLMRSRNPNYPAPQVPQVHKVAPIQTN